MYGKRFMKLKVLMTINGKFEVKGLLTKIVKKI
jgi:hypothetical protein